MHTPLEQNKKLLGLPRSLGPGLVLRWATAHDVEALAGFNARLHSDQPDQPDQWIAQWTRDLLGGGHPTTDPRAFTLVVDQEQGNAIVSTMCLISQTWSYAGLAVAVGRPELVGTLAAYRRRGLVRAQFEALHALSAQRGELVQAISGIPWYYRQFGYEMAVDLHGGRLQYWRSLVQAPDGTEERYRLRAATLEDIPLLAALYERQCSGQLLVTLRDRAVWHWLLQGQGQQRYRPCYWIIEDIDGHHTGYMEARASTREGSYDIHEIAAAAGQPLHEICAFAGRVLKAQAEELNRVRETPINHLYWDLGLEHPAYAALRGNLEQLEPSYAWYLRVPDLQRLLRHLTPVLEQRLVDSAYEGFSGPLRLNFYTSTLLLEFKRGKLADIASFTAGSVADGDACFPDLTFLQLLFGHRDCAELRYARPDCFTRRPGTALLLDTLFPRIHSYPLALI